MYPPLLEVKLSFRNEKEIKDWAIAELKKEGEVDFEDLELAASLSDRHFKAQIKLRNWKIVIGTDMDYDHIFYYNDARHRKAGPAWVHYSKNLYFINGKEAQFPNPFEHIKPFIKNPNEPWAHKYHSKDFYLRECYLSIEHLPNGTLTELHLGSDTRFKLNKDDCKSIMDYLLRNHNISIIEALLHPSEGLRFIAQETLKD